MLKRLVNEASFPFTIKNLGPLLIKSGYAEVSGYDMEPVQTYRNGKLEYYIPGSSLKGVLRSHFERIARTINTTPGVVCDPFRKANLAGGDGNPVTCEGYEEVSCGEKFQLNKAKKSGRYTNRRIVQPSNAYVYKNSCPACRLFGSTFFASRFDVSDGYLKPGSRKDVKKRDLVGIDRLTGGASDRAKFDLAAICAGAEFESEIRLRNFECWQLGAVLLLLEDLSHGLIRIGYGASRGFGNVACDLSRVTIAMIGRSNQKQEQILGLGAILSDESYGTSKDDFLEPESLPEPKVEGIRTKWEFSGKELDDLRSVALPHLVRIIEGWPQRDEMEWDPERWERAANG